MYELSTEDVRAVLRHLSRDRTPRRTPLADLELVRRQIAESGFQPTPESCIYEIGQVLTQVVETELRTLRARRAGESSSRGPDGRAASPSAGGADGVARVLADFRVGDQDLESWSAVYHVYLRPDLRLDLRSLERLLADRHRRTIQRRLKAGTESLTARLQGMERAALCASRRDRLLASLPSAASDRLIGADELVRQLRARLQHGPRDSVLALGGGPGIGKTAAALAVVRSVALCETAPEPVWLATHLGEAGEMPPENLAGEVASRCGPPAVGPSAARARASSENRIVVVDGVDSFDYAARLIAAASSLPASMSVLFAGRVCWSGLAGVRAIAVPPLDRSSSVRLLRDELARRGLPALAQAPDLDLAPVVAAACGHPMVLRAAAGELRLADAPAVARSIAGGASVFAVLADRLWSGQSWGSVDEGAREAAEAVIAADTGHRTGSRRGRVLVGAPAHDPDAALRAAVDAGLLVTVGHVRERRYRSAPFLAQYVLRLARPLWLAALRSRRG